MSKCICGVCPDTFKTIDGEDEYVCLLDDETLFKEQRFCVEELSKLSFYATLGQADGNKLTDEGEKAVGDGIRYLKMRLHVINEELKRRGKLNDKEE